MKLYEGLDLLSRNTYIGIMDKTSNSVFKKRIHLAQIPLYKSLLYEFETYNFKMLNRSSYRRAIFKFRPLKVLIFIEK